MSLPPKRELEHRGLEALAPAHLADAGDAGHHPQVGEDHAGAVAGRAGAVGVRAEQARLDAVGLREGLADRVEQPGVGRRVAAPRAADRALVDRDHAVAAGDRAVDQRALARAGDAGDDHAARRAGCRRRRPAGCAARPAHLERAGRRPHLRLQAGAVVEVAPGQRVARPQAGDGAREHDLAARRAGARAEVDDVVGDRDHLGLVLDDEHGVALVAQPLQQLVHPLDVVRVQPAVGSSKT